MSENKVIGRECRFAIHIPTYHPDKPDVHMVKEQIHYEDGTIVPNIRYIKDYKRSIWITKPNKRIHKDKKEAEFIENLNEIETTQSELRNNVAKLLDRTYIKETIKQLSSSPYLYGTEISSTSLIKHEYSKRYPDLKTAYSVAFFDIETDVLNPTSKDFIIIASLLYKNKVFTGILKNFVSGFSLIKDSVNLKIKKYIPEYIEKHNISIELFIADNSVELIKELFKRVHEWKPDLLAIWNMNFDIPQVLKLLESHHVNPKDIFCDPSTPRDFRICEYKEGPNKKITASGKVNPISPASQWHSLLCTSSYFIIDAMCVYKQIRLAKQEESSYSLDAILNKELGIRKLRFEEANQYTGLKWHQFMQSEYKLEYIVYNIFDCISMLELDEKTKDLSLTLPVYADTTDFALFKSQPKRIADSLHYFCLERGFVLGAIDNLYEKKRVAKEENETDKILSLKGWICTLPAHLSVLGMACIEEDPIMRTGLRSYIYDSDVVSAYPTCTSIANVSKSTTRKELISIENITEKTFRAQNLNLILGPTNAIEYSTIMFNLPKPTELLKLIK